MKNYLFLAIAVIAIAFFSCKDDDKDALSGTTWVCNEDVSGFDECSYYTISYEWRMLSGSCRKTAWRR